MPRAFVFTAKRQEQFLKHIRDGLDRAQAAQKIGTTGTYIRRMINEASSSYDPEFHKQYLAAIAERDPDGYQQRGPSSAAEPSRTNGNGYVKGKYLTQEELDRYLEMISDGVPNGTAAGWIGTNLGNINWRAEHDPEFNAKLREALTAGYPVFKDRLRNAAYEQAMDGNYNALRDLLMVHADEYDKLRTQRHEHGGTGGGPIKVIAANLHMLPKELLTEVIAALEQGDEHPVLTQ